MYLQGTTHRPSYNTLTCWAFKNIQYQKSWPRFSRSKSSPSIWLFNNLLVTMAPHSSTLAWKIPWTEEPGRLQSMGSRRVGPDWATSLSLFTFMHWEGNGNPLQCSCLENPRDWGAWWAAVYGVAQRQTWLKWFSSSSSMFINSGFLVHVKQAYQFSAILIVSIILYGIQ